MPHEQAYGSIWATDLNPAADKTREGTVSFSTDELRALGQRYAAAWSSGDPQGVAAFFAEDGRIVINKGDPIVGHAALAEMAAGFYAEFPDLVVHMDDIRHSGDHAIFVWTLEGKHSETGNSVKVGGWEEWTLGDDLKVQQSFGWFDAEDYDRQVADG